MAVVEVWGGGGGGAVPPGSLLLPLVGFGCVGPPGCPGRDRGGGVPVGVRGHAV